MKRILFTALSIILLLVCGCTATAVTEEHRVPHPIEYCTFAKTDRSWWLGVVPLDSIAKMDPNTKMVLPRIIKQDSPVYPSIAIRAGITATVWLEALIETDGRVSDVVVVHSDVELVNQSAMDASAKWRFSPLVVNGDTTRCIARYPIMFRLPNGKPTVYLPI